MLSTLFVATLFISQCLSQAPFTPQQVSQMRGFFETNIGRPGCRTGFVAAALSSNNPDYYYHWERDAGVSMHTLQYTDATNKSFESAMKNYVNWVQTVQNEHDNNGVNVLAEPKFNCDGSPYTGGWCRPQNDGPASRAIALTEFAFWLIDNGQKSYVEQNLYKAGGQSKQCNVPDNSKLDCGEVGTKQNLCESAGCCWYEIDNNPNNIPWCFFSGNHPTGTIARDLTYVAAVVGLPQTCDLWEEQQGVFFYTSIVQRYALYYGASLAQAMGDRYTANIWRNQAQSLDSTIKGFASGGTINDNRPQDCSIYVGSLYGGTPDDMNNAPKMFPPSDSTVLNTVASFKSYWHSVYPINSQDDRAGIPGTLIGRYGGDVYPGCKSDGGSKGHAWILCTNAVADVYYRSSRDIYKNRFNYNDHDVLNSDLLKIYAKNFEKDFPKATKKILSYADKLKKSEMFGIITMTDKEKKELIEYVSGVMASNGDAMLQRVAYHIAGCNYHMTEQLCELNGYETGAYDLTWAYGTVLSAMYHRNVAEKEGVKFYPLAEEGFNITRLFKEREQQRLHRKLLGLGDNCEGPTQCYGQCND